MEWIISGLQTGLYYWMEWIVGLIFWAILLVGLYGLGSLIVLVLGDDNEN